MILKDINPSSFKYSFEKRGKQWVFVFVLYLPQGCLCNVYMSLVNCHRKKEVCFCFQKISPCHNYRRYASEKSIFSTITLLWKLKMKSKSRALSSLQRPSTGLVHRHACNIQIPSTNEGVTQPVRPYILRGQQQIACCSAVLPIWLSDYYNLQISSIHERTKNDGKKTMILLDHAIHTYPIPHSLHRL